MSHGNDLLEKAWNQIGAVRKNKCQGMVPPLEIAPSYSFSADRTNGKSIHENSSSDNS